MPETMDYQQLPLLAATTIDKYLTGKKGKWPVINDAVSRDFAFSRLLRRAEMKVDGGRLLDFRIQLDRAQIGEWAGPFTEVKLGTTPAITTGTVPWRFYQWGLFWPFRDIDLNRGDAALVDLMKQSKSDLAVGLCEAMEAAALARDGNYTHDGTEDFLMMYGLLHWATLDGLHVTGDTSRAIAGINPNDKPNWKNAYVNPVAASDGLGGIATIYDLQNAMSRLFRLMKFDEVQFGALPQPDAASAPATDMLAKGAATRQDLLAICDAKTELVLPRVLLAREDNVGYDQYRPRPVYGGVTFYGSDKLGIDATYGYGYDASGQALWTDRTGNYASGQWKGFGETILVNTKYFHVALHEKHAPLVIPAYRPERRMGLAIEGDIWLQTVCNSRRRGLGYIGPYDCTTLAA